MSIDRTKAVYVHQDEYPFCTEQQTSATQFSDNTTLHDQPTNQPILQNDQPTNKLGQIRTL